MELAYGAYLSKYLRDALMSFVMKGVYRERFASTEMFYLDLWPFVAQALVVCNAAASRGVNRRLNAKPAVYVAQFDPQTAGPSKLSTNGAEWRRWRSLLSQGFAPSYLMGKVGMVVDGAGIFSDILGNHARKKELFKLEDAAIRFTLETLMKILLNDNLNYQREDHSVLGVIPNLATPEAGPYCYHLLSSHPVALQRLCEEHTQVFGSDPANASSLLRSSNASKHLNNLPYTVAILKETLRMYPPDGAFRTGSAAVQLVYRAGTRYPTEGCVVSVEHMLYTQTPTRTRTQTPSIHRDGSMGKVW
ncbi:hypothetical protein K458DRAFT_448113 [Lentithecium fluviatile CBS 122367]|uniref:Cytochrome P450 n=1 Tax=Lentithecium fluviatile CBS 122367 TaxID=1168545 RepID=A0A6G1JLQ9_9PLEO|nr:hypothetical protein K458DRAFT_448113 [Lentithecium fluviatile CBS 122367]